jgi:hypothetical protein
VEQESPQLGLWSTAHRRATGLVLERRRAALEQITQPRRLLLLEWSAPADVERGDVAGWRMASPHWTPQRQALIQDAHAKVLRGESVDPEEPDPVASFDAQWLNRWPAVDLLGDDADSILATQEQWEALQDADAAQSEDALLVLAVEDDLGRGACAAAAALTPDGRIVVGGYRFPTLREAVDWCEDLGLAAQDAVLLAGASILDDPELETVELPAESVGGTEFRAALPLLRTLVRTGRLAHDGGQDVTQAVVPARVQTSQGGAAMLVKGTDSTALLRCLAWAAQRAHRERY